MGEKRRAIGTIFVVTLFIGIAFVPAFGMSNNTAIDAWMQDHTVKVNSTTTCKYEQGYLLINETYTGEALKERFGVEHFTKELQMLVGDKVLGLHEGEEKIVVTEKVTVLTSGDDPPQWWDNYSYPQWAWSKSGDIYEKEDPINLAWENITKDLAKTEILEEGWFDSGTWYNFYVYDPILGWLDDDNVADDPFGLWGRYHARLWQMSDGNAVANAHHDSAVPHEADELEEAEELVAGFFNESDDTEWNVYADSYNLDNNVTTPYSDGWCTQISYGNIFDTEAPANPYPSISGNHTGTITPSCNIPFSRLYTYPCAGTGGHTEFVKIWNNSGFNATATWDGYNGDWQNIAFNDIIMLYENETYNYTIRTGSYPQIHHTGELEVASGAGTITCEEFVDANGKRYSSWIPAIKLFL